MMLKALYEKQDDVPEQYAELFSERNGKFELTGIEGVKTTADVDRLKDALSKERKERKEANEKLEGFEHIDLEQITKDKEELDETKIRLVAALKSGDGIDDEQLAKLVDAKVATQMAPVTREMDKLKKTNGEQSDLITGFETQNTHRTISDSVRKAASVSKIIETARDDVIMLAERVFEITEDGAVITKENNGVTPGVAPDVWLNEMQEKRPHWWPASQGGGAGGGSGGGFAKNPFSEAHWNMTAQGAAVREDRAKADRMAIAAGTTVGGPKPLPRKSAA